MKTLLFVCNLLLCLGITGCRQNEKELKITAYVNPFIGTDGHGHCFPGAILPFGGIQLSPDNPRNGWDWTSGYHYSDSIISSFSHTHLSGTGIGDLQDIRFLPVSTTPDTSISPAAYIHKNPKIVFIVPDTTVPIGFFCNTKPSSAISPTTTDACVRMFLMIKFKTCIFSPHSLFC